MEVAYWGALDHFEVGKNEDVKILVTKADYIGIFKEAAIRLAPNLDTQEILGLKLDSFGDKVETGWKSTLAGSKEQPIDTANEEMLKVVEVFLDTHSIEFPNLEGQPYTETLSKEASWFHSLAGWARGRRDANGPFCKLHSALRVRPPWTRINESVPRPIGAHLQW